MSQETKGVVWWKTLSGALTAVAALITAIAGLVVAFQQAGLFHREGGASPGLSPVPDPVADVRPSSGTPSGGSGAATSGSTTARSARPRETEIRAGPIVYTILATRLDRYSDESLALGFSMRFTNVDVQWGVAIGPLNFRLIADGIPIAPREAFIGVVEYQSAREGGVEFVLPVQATEVVLQLGEAGKEVRRVSIDLDRAAR
jgi:hypothetical protein